MSRQERQPITGNAPTAPKKRSTLLTVCPFILGNEFCERLAFYGLATNLVTYITKVMSGGSAYAAFQVSLFEGTCYLTPLLGAWLADSMWGRYRTILVAASVYFVGMAMLALSSAIPGLKPDPDTPTTSYQSIAFYSSLYVIALGTGGIKPNVSAFGADQFDESNPQDRLEKASFFNWFYLAINLGSLIASIFIVYIQDNISWTLGFFIPCVAMGLSVLSFIAGSPLYSHIKPSESPVARVVKVIAAALRNRSTRKQLPTSPETQRLLTPTSSANDLGSPMSYGDNLAQLAHVSTVSTVPPTSSFAWLDAAVAAPQDAQGRNSLGLLSGAVEAGFSRKQVEEVKMVLRLLPVFFTTMMYWAIYMQMGTMFVQQGTIMDNKVDTEDIHITIPAASMSAFNTISIIVLIPLWDRFLEPAISRMRGGRKLSLLQKIGWGMVLTIVAMLAAAAVEYRRLEIYNNLRPEHAASLGLGASGSQRVPMSIMWQAPQYFLVGASEVLASIGQLEFFYDQAPDVMRSCCMALQLLSTALGSYMAGALVMGVKSLTTAFAEDWLPRDLNHGRMDLFFVLLAGMMAVNLIAFVWVSLSYEYKQVQHVDAIVVDPAWEPPSPPPATTPATSPVPTAGVPIATRSRRLQQIQESLGEADPYGRSLAYQATPNLPAPFR